MLLIINILTFTNRRDPQSQRLSLVSCSVNLIIDKSPIRLNAAVFIFSYVFNELEVEDQRASTNSFRAAVQIKEEEGVIPEHGSGIKRLQEKRTPPKMQGNEENNWICLPTKREECFTQVLSINFN